MSCKTGVKNWSPRHVMKSWMFTLDCSVSRQSPVAGRRCFAISASNSSSSNGFAR